MAKFAIIAYDNDRKLAMMWEGAEYRIVRSFLSFSVRVASVDVKTNTVNLELLTGGGPIVNYDFKDATDITMRE